MRRTDTFYARNKARAATVNTKPTMTDQSQAADTDINVIVPRYAITGTAPGAPGQAIAGDFTEVPNNLRDMIEQARSVQHLRRKLPGELAEMPVEQLLALSTEDIQRILTPPAIPPVEEPKEEIK